MRTAVLVSFLTLVLTAAFALEPPGEDLSVGVSAEELTAHVKYLASDELMGRRTGTEGERLAGEYIASCFAAAGLRPAGDEGGYFARFELSARRPVPAECGLSVVPAGGEAESFAAGEAWRPFSCGADGGIVGAGVVFAGYGLSAPELSYDDYAGIDVTGKVVAIMRRGPGGAKPRFQGRDRQHLSFIVKLTAAEQHGAAGVILIDDRHHYPKEADRCPTEVGGGLKPPKIPFVFATRAVVTPMFAAAGADPDALAAAIDTEGPQSRPLAGVQVDLTVKSAPQYGTNVIGLIPGGDPKLAAETIVVGAHYDHLGTDGMGGLDSPKEGRLWNGADDNASGTSGMLELAEHFALVEPGPKRTMIFVAFAGEELGLLGSSAYTKSPAVPLEQTIAMVNLDMIGRSKEGGLFVGGTGTAAPFDALVATAAEGSGLAVSRSASGFAPSDHMLFTQRGIPTLFFFTGIHPDYHKTTDDWDKLNYADQKKVVDLAAKVIAGIDALPGRPAFVNVPRPRARGPQLGISLAQGGDEPGAVVGSVMAGTPAAGAGLQDGDRIVKLAGKEVKDRAGLIAILQSLKPDAEVEVVVVREAGTETLTVKFGER
jgi:hypothetical protein